MSLVVSVVGMASLPHHYAQLVRSCAHFISSGDLMCQACLASAALSLPCRAMASNLQKFQAGCLQASWWTPLPCACESGRGSDCVVAIPTLVPCNRVGNANRLRAWVLQFFTCSWSPAATFKPGSLQGPAHQDRRFCKCCLRETSHIPAASLAPPPPETLSLTRSCTHLGP